MANNSLAPIFGVLNKFHKVVTSPASATQSFAVPRLTRLNDMVYEVHSPPPGQEPELEVIFFHGLQIKPTEDAYATTWMTKDNSQFWPKTFLGDSFPNARIFTISYDASAGKTDQFGRLDMYCTVENLLSSLTADEVRVGQARCPVVLVGHCLGGLVIKNLCLSAAGKVSRKTTERIGVSRDEAFVSSLRGMFFYSTPHAGSLLGDELRKNFHGELLNEIETMKDSNVRKNEEFNELMVTNQWVASAVGEAYETFVEYLQKRIHVVPEAASRLLKGEYYTVQEDHYNVCKPERKNSTSFLKLKDLLHQVLALAPTKPKDFAKDEDLGLPGTIGDIRRFVFGDELPVNAALHAGESLVSNDTTYTFTNQEDGNLCVFHEDRGKVWSSNTKGAGWGDLSLLTDGNLVLFDTGGTGKPIWASMSQTKADHLPFSLSMQNDGNLVIYTAGDRQAPWAIWSEKSSGKFTNSDGNAEMHSTHTWLASSGRLVSTNGMFELVNQEDGDLCIYNEDRKATWISETRGQGAGNLYMQKNGDLVLYNTDGVGTSESGAVIWSSGTFGIGVYPYTLVMQDDGNLVIKDASDTPTWSSSAGSIGLHRRSELLADGTLHSGEALVSDGNQYTFLHRLDGDLVTYHKNGQRNWHSSTSGRLSQGDLVLLKDGNLVLFDTNGTGAPVWASMSQEVSRSARTYRLVIQDDGNLVIYGNERATWASLTLDRSHRTSGPFISSAGKAQMLSDVTWLGTNDTLVSRNRMFRFVNQHDGNLCIYNRNGRVEWSSRTQSRGAGNLYMQRDGNLVFYNTDSEVGSPGAPIWSSSTFGRGTGPYKLVMQDDGRLVIYDANQKQTWASDTGPLWRSAVIRSELAANETLHSGEALVSKAEASTFINQENGNLATYTKHGGRTWASNTSLSGGDLTLLTDGNLVLFDTRGTGSPAWASMSQGIRSFGPYKLVMQDDRNLVIYGVSGATWATRTLDRTSGRFTSSKGQAEMPSGVTWLEVTDTLVSRNRRHTFVNQADGNLCIYNRSGNVEWTSGTQGRGSGNVYMQPDGNLVFYNTDGDGERPGAPIWASNTYSRGTGPYKLIMQDDGNLVIHDIDHQRTWASNNEL